eukprot:TRINITY_DN9531_c0_g2_i1.p2 TRINITY_DN9531_c0_g2~~TRINITY_DN9531_c0_g2_i1.p2  ORF type:complete len:187 (+),score=52.72 TRINITY_DN9531_c0_g2_i1:157-717(+)
MVRKEILLKYLREQMTKCKETHCYQSAIFYADKIVTLCKDTVMSSDYVSSMYELAQCYFCNKEYLRVVQLLDKSGLSFFNERFRVLLGQAFFFAGNYDECINVLETNLMEETTNPAAGKCFTDTKEELYFQSLKHLVLGKAYEAQENKAFAVQNLKQALTTSCENVEAFERLISNYLLPHEESKAA